MNNIIEMDKKLREYEENVRKLNKNEMILKLREAKILISTVLDILEDPEDK
jgi:hypothetical protein